MRLLLISVSTIRSKQAFFQKRRKIAPPISDKMDMNFMTRFVNLIKNSIRRNLNLPERQYVYSPQFGWDPPSIGQFGQAVSRLKEFVQNRICHVRAFSVSNERNNIRNVSFSTARKRGNPSFPTYAHCVSPQSYSVGRQKLRQSHAS